jgi:hypothetical protein
MGQLGGDCDLAEKSLRAYLTADLWSHDFERYMTVMSNVSCEVNVGHSARANTPDDCVLVG